MNDSLIAELTSVVDTNADKGTFIELPDAAPFDPEQRQWLNGLLAGLSTIAAVASTETVEGSVATPLKVLYGSQSGNCEVLSKDMRKFAATKGFEAELVELDTIPLAELAEHEHVVIICSTFGEGEPPDNAKNFYEAIMADNAPALPASLNFSVCGLGDSSYTHFNKMGIDIFNRMQELGATPCHDLVSCDVAFEDDYAEWKEGVFGSDAFVDAASEISAITSDEAGEDEPRFTKNNPFIANLIETVALSGENSSKSVMHIEISIAGGGQDMHYDVGDALGVWPLNCPEEVSDILAAGGFTGNEQVQLKSGPARLKTLLSNKLDISTVNDKAREVWGLDSIPDGYQVYDVLKELAEGLDAQTFVDGLRPIQPRLYSIASSPKAHPGEVHLTVGEVYYDLNAKPRKGVASTWLGNRLQDGANLGVYVQRSAHFHIPADDSAPLIMIGPGTGIAPFRAFLEEREMRQAPGDNWLFFGDQNEANDYLYQEQINTWKEQGVLNNLSLAWSRDTDKKIYVQTLIKQRGKEFFEWLERGAYIYICGDASRMAADVDLAIREVICEHGDYDSEGAEAYMQHLAKAHRYQRDVY